MSSIWENLYKVKKKITIFKQYTNQKKKNNVEIVE